MRYTNPNLRFFTTNKQKKEETEKQKDVASA